MGQCHGSNYKLEFKRWTGSWREGEPPVLEFDCKVNNLATWPSPWLETWSPLAVQTILLFREPTMQKKLHFGGARAFQIDFIHWGCDVPSNCNDAEYLSSLGPDWKGPTPWQVPGDLDEEHRKKRDTSWIWLLFAAMSWSIWAGHNKMFIEKVFLRACHGLCHIALWMHREFQMEMQHNKSAESMFWRPWAKHFLGLALA
jgi:hypothetical protein